MAECYCERLIGSIRRECLEPYRGLWRAASSAFASNLCQLLQSYPNAPVVEQGLTGVACRRIMRSHIAGANSGRIAPPIPQDLVSDRDTPARNAPWALQNLVYFPEHLGEWHDADYRSILVFIVRALNPVDILHSLGTFLGTNRPILLADNLAHSHLLPKQGVSKQQYTNP